MYLSARARIILENILSKKQDLSVSELAHWLNVSERTVRRDLEEVRQTLAQFELVLDKKGSRLSVTGADENRETILQTLLQNGKHEFTPFERKQQLIQILLKKTEPVKLVSLAYELSVTVATVSSDLSRIEEDWHGKLRIKRRRGIGVVLEASITIKRELIRELIFQSIPKIKLQHYFSNPDLSAASPEEFNFLSAFIDFDSLKQTDYVLTRWMKKLPYEIQEDSYLHLLLYLLIAVKQIELGQFAAEKEDQPIFIQDYPEYDIAERILQDALPEFSIPETEKTELTMQILESEIHTGEAVFYRNEKVQAIRIAKKLISRVTRELGLPLAEMPLLLGLSEHIQYSLVRLKKNLPPNNPLLSLIRSEFGELFDSVHKIASELYPFPALPEEESGFIVLHFEAAILQAENLRPYSALVVTSRSNGVTTWIRAKFKKRLPKLQKMKFVTPLELTKETDFEKYDIILSTTELSDFAMDYEWISIFISDEEIAKIEAKLEQKVSAEKNTQTVQNHLFDTSLTGTIAELKRVHNYSLLVLSFLESIIIEQESAMTRNAEDNLRKLSGRIAELNERIDGARLFGKLNSLESKRKMISAGMNTGIFVVNENVDRAALFTFKLAHSIDFQMDGEVKSGVSLVMIFVLPYELNAAELEIVTYLLNMLTEDDSLVPLAESGGKKSLEAFFAVSLREFLEQKKTQNFFS
ncbi:BglG family transcription antiterminator [Listeria kieliensis]|uniref:Transcriptional antiterminator, BglG n=1 Tax=Listeria kieliensis TaxID=1621700 RepID=A0A3D8TSZ7_9LIST|nr:PRD domain-containing protein [Listeria kieliensis]RDX02080.1 transcriptional antiterminator, BglG [Listeria kieliensis]